MFSAPLSHLILTNTRNTWQSVMFLCMEECQICTCWTRPINWLHQHTPTDPIVSKNSHMAWLSKMAKIEPKVSRLWQTMHCSKWSDDFFFWAGTGMIRPKTSPKNTGASKLSKGSLLNKIVSKLYSRGQKSCLWLTQRMKRRMQSRYFWHFCSVKNRTSGKIILIWDHLQLFLLPHYCCKVVP